MKHFLISSIIAVCVSCVALPLAAQGPDDEKSHGFSLIEEGIKLLFQGLLNDVEPALDEMGRALTNLEPILRDLAGMVDDLNNYEMPEKLPNGDIIIRRKLILPEPQEQMDL
ncbi:MAG: AAA+ family ATPase [Paracoccaceae bacterium]|nr:AAA+ family ATPase [Paracoccaceae bacterium]